MMIPLTKLSSVRACKTALPKGVPDWPQGVYSEDCDLVMLLRHRCQGLGSVSVAVRASLVLDFRLFHSVDFEHGKNMLHLTQ